MQNIFGHTVEQFKEKINYTQLVANLKPVPNFYGCWQNQIKELNIDGKKWKLHGDPGPNISEKKNANLSLSYKLQEKHVHVSVYALSSPEKNAAPDMAMDMMSRSSMMTVTYDKIFSDDQKIIFGIETTKGSGYSRVLLAYSNYFINTHTSDYDQDVKEFADQILAIIINSEKTQYNPPVFAVKLSEGQPKVGKEITISVASNQKIDHEIELDFRNYIDGVDPTTTRTEAKIKFLKAGKYSMPLIAMDKDTLYTETLNVEVDVNSGDSK